jgi:hypothetical protein
MRPALAIVLLLSAASARIIKDEIKQLPGWPEDLPSRIYSGYLEVPGDHPPDGKYTGNKYYHYTFVESEGNPATDPVGLWLNGGPGSSSLIGMFTENGPFMTSIDSIKEALPYGNTTVPKLFHREYSWVRNASFIFLESPAGVGFSYCDYGIANHTACALNKTTGCGHFPCAANDTSTAVVSPHPRERLLSSLMPAHADHIIVHLSFPLRSLAPIQDNHLVLKAFFTGFPEFAKNDFYITGESYAGICKCRPPFYAARRAFQACSSVTPTGSTAYFSLRVSSGAEIAADIPMLVEQISKAPNNPIDTPINIKGFAVGNGCWGNTVGLCSFGSDMDRIWQQFLYGHNAITPVAYKKIIKYCGDPMDGPGSWSNCSGLGPECSGPFASMLTPSDKYQSAECQSALKNVSASEFTGQGRTANYEIYNYYDTCYSTTDIRRRALRQIGMTPADRKAHMEYLRRGGQFGAAVHIGEAPLTSGGALNDYSCDGMGAMGVWLKQPEVIEALHVQNDGTHRYPGAVAYSKTVADVRPLYKQLIMKYRVMIYSGDTDACVPTVGTEEWTASLGLPVRREWAPWHGGTKNNATAHFVTAGASVLSCRLSPLRPKGRFAGWPLALASGVWRA